MSQNQNYGDDDDEAGENDVGDNDRFSQITDITKTPEVVYTNSAENDKNQQDNNVD
jgi:hypothetical protein